MRATVGSGKGPAHSGVGVVAGSSAPLLKRAGMGPVGRLGSPRNPMHPPRVPQRNGARPLGPCGAL
jgi:hypothetical protein